MMSDNNSNKGISDNKIYHIQFFIISYNVNKAKDITDSILTKSVKTSLNEIQRRNNKIS